MSDSVSVSSSIYSLLSTIIISLVALILIIVIYFLIYRHRINKALKEGTSKYKRTAMPSVGSTATFLFVALWTFSTVIMLLQLQSISGTAAIINNDLEEVKRELSQCQEDVRDLDAYYLRWLFEDERKSIISKYNYRLGTYYPEDHTVDLKIMIVPTSAAKTDKFHFKMGDYRTDLKRNNDGSYGGTLRIDIFEEDISAAIVTMESQYEKISEVIGIEPMNNQYYDDPKSWNDYFPSIESNGYDDSMSLSYWYEDTNEKIEVNYEQKIDIYESHANYDKNYTFDDMKLVFEVNGKNVKEVDLKNSKEVIKNDNCYTYNANETFNVEERDFIMVVYLYAKDKYGYNYKYHIISQDINSNSNEKLKNIYVPEYHESKIYSKDGNLLISFIRSK